MDAFLKRKAENTGGPSKKPKHEACPHGPKCYRRNPHHFREYEHPHLIKLLEMAKPEIPLDFPLDKSVYLEQVDILRPLLNIKPDVKPSTSSSSVTNTTKPGTMLEKLQNAAPYNLFFTTIPESAETLKHPTSITFTDLLCPSLGELKCSLQINFMIDIMWLMERYRERNLGKKPLTILYGDEFPKMKEFIEKFLPNVSHHYVKMKDPFGCHHSKIGIYFYEDNSLRVVISTANLYYEDWNHYNQGLWLSPPCPQLPETATEKSGESPTGFKSSLLNYLKHYNLPVLKPWIDYVKRADFSAVRVFLVTSVPGKHYPGTQGSHVHHVGDLLSRHCSLPAKTGPDSEGPLSWGIIAQASSIGSMGKSPAEWLRSTLLRSLSGHKQTQLVSNSNATLSIIFPSVDNVMNGYFGAESGGCLPYSKQTNEKQRWLQSYLHQWKADKLGRSRAMPHIKTYCRVSPCLSKLAWFFITSANLSKSAWGGNLQKDKGAYVRSYEAGVMFLPKFFDEEYFEIETTLSGKNKKLFPFMYDLPLTEYKSSDYPWCN
ncbi:probable tyrosyl-DNA phosphodiesterase isoform X1 [Tribolium castaneum]|uniref:Putative tyrosyl-DNA phosphodiesterase-like Protein n=1 Tax=Tribolium castaneum TaxID=7070 RepID=D7GXI0_TRICA|nr:PREDICTED: probable tyrosyl-DNA phosphodiesterase isoform X1 [Tribolium castaneum]EFA13677.2 putative tyrosyl-DNA phosphodiesterase-like Protein [Tribolium castaneum]|eukprot:XP_008191977.1 PREDICTED: probable tyrosyl-DNA phosphodiesterase isoform X1 [Tribolium castaneum]